MSQRRSGERAAQREHCAPAGVTMAIGEKESKQIKQNTSRDGMCVCVCMGVVSGLRAKLWLVAAPSARQKVAGGAVMGLQAFGSPCPGFFFFFLAEQEVQGWPGGCAAAQHPWIAACIPEPRAKCSTLGGMGACAPWALPPPGCRRMLQPPGFGSGAGCREGRRCLKTGMSAFLWLRSVFAPGVAQPGIFAVSSVGARGYL